jgi:hypothetical protein
MSKYYIVDSTQKQNGKNPVFLFEEKGAVLNHLESMCQRQFKQTRKQHMQHCEDLGFGSDEATGQAFYNQMEQYFNIGVIRGNSTPVKCNIFQADSFKNSKDVHGN